jgi:hypothetical protein
MIPTKKVRNSSLPSYESIHKDKSDFPPARKKSIEPAPPPAPPSAATQSPQSRFKRLKNSSCFNFFLILVVSVLTNSLYFNFYYLPHLNSSVKETRDSKPVRISHQNRLQIEHARKFDLLTWNSDSSESYADPSFDMKSYDHVSFASVGDYDDRGRPADDSQTQNGEYSSSSIIGFNDNQFEDDRNLKRK